MLGFYKCRRPLWKCWKGVHLIENLIHKELLRKHSLFTPFIVSHEDSQRLSYNVLKKTGFSWTHHSVTHCILFSQEMITSVTMCSKPFCCSGTFSIICYAVIAVLINCNGHFVILFASACYYSCLFDGPIKALTLWCLIGN